MAETKNFNIRKTGFSHSDKFNRSKEKLKNPWQTTLRILGYLGKKKWQLILIFIFSFITTISLIFGTRLNGYVIDEYIKIKDLKGLSTICIILLIMYLISNISTFIQNRLMVNISQLTSSNIRKDLFTNIQKIPLKYFDTHSSGDIMSRLTNDIDNISMTLSQSINQFFSGIINVVGMLIAMLILSPILTLVALITIPLMLIVTKLIVKNTQPLFVKQQKELGTLNGYIEEIISAQKTVLLFSKEKLVKKDFSKINKNLTHYAILANAISGFMGPINNFINNLSYLTVAVLGGYLAVSSNHKITVGVIFSFIIYMKSFTRPINEILSIFNIIQNALAGGERVFEVIDENKEQDFKNSLNLENVKGHIKFESVDFSYDENKKILKNLTLEANPGSVIAVVGPTGAGKTTIVNLITKFYDIDSGKILIDNKDIKYLKRESLRKNISMVLQDTFLFSDTIIENIRYGNINATNEDVINASKIANAHLFISQLPNGYNTILTENGNSLSHGQRQLLSIARAVLSKTSILILDEATSSIDTNTEIEIQKAMLNLMKGKTTFVIAHRLSTIKNADKIITLKEGEIIESGTHNELIELKGFYANLYNSQFSKVE